MYATILQQMTNQGVKPVAIIPLLDGTIKLFEKRGKGLRGSAGAWEEIDSPDFVGKAVGQPVSRRITASDYKTLPYPITPTVLLQKLGRTIEDVNTPSTTDFIEQFNIVLGIAKSDPVRLVQYEDGQAVAAAPQPVVYQPAEDIALPSEEYVAEQTITVVESEPQMELSSTVAPQQHLDDAVLTVPDPELYVERTFYDMTEETILDTARKPENRWNVLYTGDAGTGKTSSARNYAAKRGLPFVVIECTQQITESITQGRFVPTGQGNAMRWKYSQLATAIQQPSVILINELTRMTPKAASLFLRLLNERELVIEPNNQVIKVHDECIFIADQNTGLGYTGTSKQDAALVDRFNVKLEFHYDIEIEKKFIDSPTLLQFAQNIREASELNDEFSVPMSTRILKNFQAQARELNFEFAIESMLSNYPKMDGERDAIKMRFDADAQQIADELGVSLGKYSTR